jgi:2-polyprenyl-6-methoxyphenol hydroxylase-like FAD-dependent oxidoreductase
VRGTARGDGSEATVRARLVVGADGKHSLVAREAGATAYQEEPASTAACYTYWSGVDLAGGELYARDGRAVGAWPTNDGLVMTYVGWPIAEFDELRTDVEGNLLKTLDDAGDLGDRVRAGTRAERIRSSNDVPNRFRVPHGPAGRWSATPAWCWIRSPARASGTRSAKRSC